MPVCLPAYLKRRPINMSQRARVHVAASHGQHETKAFNSVFMAGTPARMIPDRWAVQARSTPCHAINALRLVSVTRKVRSSNAGDDRGQSQRHNISECVCTWREYPALWALRMFCGLVSSQPDPTVQIAIRHTLCPLLPLTCLLRVSAAATTGNISVLDHGPWTASVRPSPISVPVTIDSVSCESCLSPLPLTPQAMIAAANQQAMLQVTGT